MRGGAGKPRRRGGWGSPMRPRGRAEDPEEKRQKPRELGHAHPQPPARLLRALGDQAPPWSARGVPGGLGWDLTDSRGCLIWLQGFCGFYSTGLLFPTSPPPCARKSAPHPQLHRGPRGGGERAHPVLHAPLVLPSSWEGGVRTGVGGLLWGGGEYRGPLHGAGGEDRVGDPSWSWG